MGGDSAAVSGWDIKATASPKVFINGDMLIGYTSSFRMGQLLQYKLNIPEYIEDMDDTDYLVSKFIPAVKECLKDGGYMKIENNQDSGGVFLVGFHGKVYQVDEDYQVLRCSDGFTAVGCGGSFAVGALSVILATTEDSPEKAILYALRVAGRFSAGVCAPYYVISG
jgi:ATP-dependent protease HslVU (ClpYQ) peptidase subunit